MPQPLFPPPYAPPTDAYPNAAPPPYPYPYPSMPYPPMPYPPAALMQPPNSRRRPGYFVAACGSLLALLAFFGFPFLTVTASLSSSLSGAPSSLSYSQSVTASQLAGTSNSLSLGESGLGSLALGLTSLLWIIAIVAGGALLLSIAVPFSLSAFHNGTHVLSGWALIAGGVAAAGLTTVIALAVLDQINQSIQSLTNDLGISTSSLGFNISVSLGIGFYVLVVALLAIASGGIIVLVRRDRRVQPPLPVPAAMPAQPTTAP